VKGPHQRELPLHGIAVLPLVGMIRRLNGSTGLRLHHSGCVHIETSTSTHPSTKLYWTKVRPSDRHTT